MTHAIRVENVGKKFYRYHPDRPRTLSESFVRGWKCIKPKEVFWGLRNITFSVGSGQIIGVIGKNGAGKSTLLRIIGGVIRPNEGSVQVNGHMGALLSIGASFHPDLSGRENVFISGVVEGLTRREVTHRFESIVEFAELQDVIESPLRTYSTGMRMRLAFAVAIHTAPEILLVDEVLAVGDLAFRRKCLTRIEQLRTNGCTIFLVSHDTTQIQKLCDKVLWLREGRMVAHGDPEAIVKGYVTEMTVETRKRTPAGRPTVRTSTGADLQINKNRFGSLELEIEAVRFLGTSGLPVTEINSGNSLIIEIEYFAHKPIPAPIFGVAISQKVNDICCTANTAADGVAIPIIQGRGKIKLTFERLDLNGGQYFVDVGAYERNWSYTYDYHWHVYTLLVHPFDGKKGVLRPPHQWEFESAGELTVKN
jgi:lipopolysaccharide transport system ATP-binding protein